MSLSTRSIEALAWPLGWTLVHFLCQGTFIALLLACVLSMFHHRSAQLRHALCCCALGLMVAVPLITFSHLSHSLTDSRSMSIDVTPNSLPLVVHGSSLPESRIARLIAIIDQATPSLVVMWVAGVVVLVSRLLVALMIAHRLKNRGTTPVPTELQQNFERLLGRFSISRPVRLMRSVLVQVPTVVGWLRPVILVPASFLTGLSPVQAEAILAHELAHIRRHDYLISVLQALAEAILFYHPAVWWVSRKIRTERECCCDEIAISLSGSAISYARALTLLEEHRSENATVSLAANGGVLAMRIQRILGLAKGPVLAQPAAVMLLGALIAATSLAAFGRAQSPVSSAQLAALSAADLARVPAGYQAWLRQDVRWIIQPEERSAFLRLTDNTQRDHFIKQFWLHRDPPGSAPNTYRVEHYRRIAYANLHFAEDVPGWEADRGRIYIVYGKPSSVDAYPSGSATNVQPFEIWKYGAGSADRHSFEVRFVDICSCGSYKVASASGQMAESVSPGAAAPVTEQRAALATRDVHVEVLSDTGGFEATSYLRTIASGVASNWKPSPIRAGHHNDSDTTGAVITLLLASDGRVNSMKLVHPTNVPSDQAAWSAITHTSFPLPPAAINDTAVQLRISFPAS